MLQEAANCDSQVGVNLGQLKNDPRYGFAYGEILTQLWLLKIHLKELMLDGYTTNQTYVLFHC